MKVLWNAVLLVPASVSSAAAPGVPMVEPQSTCPWTAEGDQEGSGFGIAVATAGDVNGDGHADVIVGAHRFDNGETDEGRAHVFLGSATGLSTSPAWTAESDQADAFFGQSVATAGDVNADGFGDVIVGAFLFEDGESDEGRAHVYLGSATGLSTSAAWTAESDQADAFFGLAVASAGDVDDDGFGDVIVAAPIFACGQPNEGRAYVYLGSATGLSSIPTWTVEGDLEDAFFGLSVAPAGDVNDDGYGDVLVAAPSLACGQLNEGRAHAYLGSASGLSTSPAWTVEGDEANAFFGLSVAPAGDVNGDGHGDVIVGAPGFDDEHGNEGRARVYLGSATGLSTSPVWTTGGQASVPNSQLGSSVSTAGDVNGDGHADVIVGAQRFDGDEPDEGRVYVHLGSAGFVSSAVFAGDGINADTIAPLNAIIGSAWSAPLRIGHDHGASGPVSLMVRSTTVNGSNFTSPSGGRLTEFLIGGPFLARIAGTHDGATGGIPVQTIPNLPALVGVSWAAQYVVVGGGFGDLSQAVFGVVGCP